MLGLTCRFSFPSFPVVLGLALLVSACASDDDVEGPTFEEPSTAIDYEVVLEGLPEEEMIALAQSSLAVYRQQEDGAQSLAFLKQRAKGDVALIQKILRSNGYYNGSAKVKVIRPELPEGTPEDQRPPPLVTISVDPGPPFTLTRHDFQVDNPSGTAPPFSPQGLGSPVGEQARAAPIVASEGAAVKNLQRQGFPYAERGKRRAVADLEENELEIDTPVVTGPAATYGKVRFSGLEDVRERYLRTYLPWEEGETFDLDQLRDYQRELLGTDLFETVRVTPPSEPPDTAGPAPLEVLVDADERPFRTIAVGARYSTDDGPSVSARFQHRNLWGENETLSVEGELGLQVQHFGIGYVEPQYLRNGQDLIASLSLRREEDDAFDDLTATAFLGLERELSPTWTVGAGGLLEASLIDDDGEETTAFLGGLPVFAEYDGSDDQLNPTTGQRARFDITPFGGIFDDEFAAFLLLDTTASTYFDLTGDKKYILAGRGRLGSIIAEDLDTVPPTRRLYSGGGGSVRGYAQRFIGPLDENNDPTGGLSVAEVGAEFRAQFFGDIGGVIFVEAGSVSEEMFPDFNEGLQAAAGVGFRYFSPAGPIRVDVALPINGRDADDAFQFYFSIGQAF